MYIPWLHEKLCDLGTRGFARLFPPPGEPASFGELYELREEYGWIETSSTLGCLGGFLVGLVMPYLRGECTGWDVLVCFGLGCLLPMVMVAAIGAWIGLARFNQYVRYCSHLYGYNWWAATLLMGVPGAIFGMLGAWMVYFR